MHSTAKSLLTKLLAEDSAPIYDDLDVFTKAYIYTALETSSDENDYYLDQNYGPGEIEYAAYARMVNDCKNFQRINASLLALEDPRLDDKAIAYKAGTDFWLTRNGHGSGFFEWKNEMQAELLANSAHAFGSQNLYVTDSGTIGIE